MLIPLWLPLAAEAAEPPPPVRLSIVAPPEARAGDTVPVAVLVDVPAGWHIYWENPGQSGLPTDARLTVTGAAAATVSGPRWPVPKRFTADGLVNYGYEGKTGLVFDLQIPSTPRRPHDIALHAAVSWLLCKDMCVTGSGSVASSMAVVRKPGDAPPNDPVAPALAALPLPFADSGGTVSRADGDLRITLPGPGPFDVFPSLALEAVWAPELTELTDGGLVIESRLPSRGAATETPSLLRLVVTQGVGPARRGYTLTLPESP